MFVVEAGGQGFVVQDFPVLFPIALQQVILMNPLAEVGMASLPEGVCKVRTLSIEAMIRELRAMSMIICERFHELQRYREWSFVHSVGPGLFMPPRGILGVEISVAMDVPTSLDPKDFDFNDNNLD